MQTEQTGCIWEVKRARAWKPEGLPGYILRESEKKTKRPQKKAAVFHSPCDIIETAVYKDQSRTGLRSQIQEHLEQGGVQNFPVQKIRTSATGIFETVCSGKRGVDPYKSMKFFGYVTSQIFQIHLFFLHVFGNCRRDF